jgi:NDP-sugar pyrophosphorylase family protein
MQIDFALILSAGLGTRMGEIGKKLPKALWPVFYKSLLELQIDYCHDLGIKKIFINVHFLADEIKNYIKSDKKFKDIILLHEDPLLDSGGAIHNMAQRNDVNYKGTVLLVNSDQFLFFDKKYFQEALTNLKDARASLFGIKVDKAAKYNETILVNGQLKEIKKSNGMNDYVTYSGLGILKLDGLKPVPGISRFFETVTDYQKEKVCFVVPESFEYWDFGTAEIYFNSIKNIFQNLKENKKTWLMDFLYLHNAFNGDETNFYSPELNSISLEGKTAFEANSIVGIGIVQKV